MIDKEMEYGFRITEEEMKAITEWQNNHNKRFHSTKSPEDWIASVGSVGDQYAYTFVPTSIGILGVVKCGCGESFTFRNIF